MNSLVATEASGLLLPLRLEDNDDQSSRQHQGQASQQDTIINLMKTCMGTGTLALPFAAAQGGLYLNTLGLLLIALWNLYSVQRLCHCLELIPKDADPPKRATTFGRVAWYAMGDAGLHALDGMMIILLCGIIVACKFSLRPLVRDSPPRKPNPSLLSCFSPHRRRRRDELYGRNALFYWVQSVGCAGNCVDHWTPLRRSRYGLSQQSLCYWTSGAWADVYCHCCLWGLSRFPWTGPSSPRWFIRSQSLVWMCRLWIWSCPVDL